MRPRERELLQRLPDRRGNRVVILAHCLLDENVRYLGGAFHAGAVPEVGPILHNGIGICQMPCPEMRAWGGVHKRLMLMGYGLQDTPLYQFRRPLVRLFALYTRDRYWWLARQVSKETKRYHDAGVTIVGIVGIGASPSCGVHSTLDLERSFEAIADAPSPR